MLHSIWKSPQKGLVFSKFLKKKDIWILAPKTGQIELVKFCIFGAKIQINSQQIFGKEYRKKIVKVCIDSRKALQIFHQFDEFFFAILNHETFWVIFKTCEIVKKKKKTSQDSITAAIYSKASKGSFEGVDEDDFLLPISWVLFLPLVLLPTPFVFEFFFLLFVSSFRRRFEVLSKFHFPSHPNYPRKLFWYNILALRFTLIFFLPFR